MTSPNGYTPGEAIQDLRAWQEMTQEQALSQAQVRLSPSWEYAQNTHTEQVRQPLAVVQGAADQAVSDASAAVNAALAAEATAASAFEAAAYWETEVVVASAAVVLGVNELLIGLCQNVPGGLNRLITDMHVALLSQPNGMEFELRKWDDSGTTSSNLADFSLPANGTRASWNFPDGLNVAHRERLYWNVTSVTGTVAPVVFQALVFGVFEIP